MSMLAPHESDGSKMVQGRTARAEEHHEGQVLTA